MNHTHSYLSRRALLRPARPSGQIALATVIAASFAIATSGCAKDRVFSVNGQVVTKDEYIKMLERQNVVAPGGGTSTGIKSALDQIVGNKVILAEATKEGVVPNDDEVKNYYNTQKKLFMATNPGKDYEKTMSEEGTTPQDVQDQMKIQLAEAAVYAKKFGITDTQIEQAYQQVHGFGLPPRVQLRLIIPTSPAELPMVQQALASKSADFNAVADQFNPPQLKATHGLWPQAIPLAGGMAPDLASKVQQTAEGAFFGPIDFRTSQNPKSSAVKAWIKVEKKMPGLTIPLEDAKDLVKSQLVQQKLRDPSAQAIREELIKEKLNVSFEADPKYATVWTALKTNAAAALASQGSAAISANPAGNPVANPAGGAATSATAPLTK